MKFTGQGGPLRAGDIRGGAVGGVTNCAKNQPLSLLVPDSGLGGQKCLCVCSLRGCIVGGINWNGQFLVGELTELPGGWGGKGCLAVLISLGFRASMTRICWIGVISTGKVRVVEVLGSVMSAMSRVIGFEFGQLGTGPADVAGWLGPSEEEPAVTGEEGLVLALFLTRYFLPTELVVVVGIVGASFSGACEDDRVSGV